MRRVLGISSVLTLNDIGRIDFVHTRRIGHRLVPGWCRLLPKAIALPFPDQVPLRSGISSCARGSSYGAKLHQREHETPHRFPPLRSTRLPPNLPFAPVPTVGAHGCALALL